MYLLICWSRLLPIFSLKTEGIIQGEGRPIKYDLFPTVKSYIQYLSDKANGRKKKATDQENESLKIEAEARFKQAKAEMEELPTAHYWVSSSYTLFCMLARSRMRLW